MPRKRELQIQKDKNRVFIEMAAEQIALLLWKQCTYINNLFKSNSKGLNIQK